MEERLNTIGAVFKYTFMRKFLIVVLLAFLVSSCDKSSDAQDPVPDPDEKEIIGTIKVMSYNIHHCNPPSKAGVIDIEAIVRAIRAESPDLVALQEVDVNTERSGEFNQAAEIANALEMYYFFGKAIDFQGGDYGVAILSKYPLSETFVHRLPTESGTNGEARVIATANLELMDGSTISFGSTHLDAQSDPANRLLQIQRIAEIAASEELPFIIAGDFNATPESEVIQILDGSFTRTCRLCSPTIPVVTPTRAIDYIAFRHPGNKWSVESHKVVNETYASDHRPVVSVLNIEK